MKNCLWLLAVALLAIPLIGMAAQQQEKEGQGPLPWAYGGDASPDAAAFPPSAMTDPKLLHVPGSEFSFTLAQIRSFFGPSDWFPNDHGPIPDIVEHGKKPDVESCAVCHFPNGKGRPENAPVSGLPVEYFVRQMLDFRSGARKSSEPRKSNAKRMGVFARGMTDDEIRTAAEYFGSIPWTMTWIKVVETKNVPKTRILNDGLFLKVEGNETEPLGTRIIEVPENTEASSVLRNDHSPYIAYVPVGSIKKGEALVTTGGGGKTVQCTICHGTHLEGIGPVPPIAGRQATYYARQLYDFQHGNRKGPWSGLMQKAVEKLTAEDIVDICAYLASRPVAADAKAASRQAPVASPAMAAAVTPR